MKRPAIKTVRRLVQAGVALGLVALPWLNSRGWREMFGNLLFFNAAGLPLGDPLAAAQVALAGWPPPAILLQGAGIALGLALVLGTVFCSWGCPFGLLSELVSSARRRFRAETAPSRPNSRNGLPVKTALAIGGLMLSLVGGLPPLLNQISLPGWYSRVFQVWFLQGHLSLTGAVILAVLAVEFALGRRLWCRYLCPQSVLLTVVQNLNSRRLKVAFSPRNCNCGKGDEPCLTSCSLDLNPRRLISDLEAECTNCGDCVVACRTRGRALRFRMGSRKNR